MSKGFTSETDKAYVAGFFDGDGHVSIMLYGNHHSIGVGISQKTRGILDWIQEAYGGKIYKCSARPYEDSIHLYPTKHQWVIYRAVDVDKFLSDILPFVRVKKAQVLLGIEFCKTVNIVRGGRGKDKTLSNEVIAFRRDLKEKMTALNACKRVRV